MWFIIFLNAIDNYKLYHIFGFNFFLDFGKLANLLCFAMKCHPLFFQMLCFNALEYLAILINITFLVREACIKNCYKENSQTALAAINLLEVH